MKAFEFDMWIAVNCCEVRLGKQCIIRKLPDAALDWEFLNEDLHVRVRHDPLKNNPLGTEFCSHPLMAGSRGGNPGSRNSKIVMSYCRRKA
jgi:hypothetical protein